MGLRRMNRASWRVAPALCALAGASACDQPANEYAPPPPPEVTVAAPAVRDVTRYIEVPGRLEARESVEVRARVRGYLESIEFEPSSLVDPGQLLFRIERDGFEAALNSAQGRLAQARAALALSEATLERVRQARAQDAASDLEVLEAEAEREAAAGAVTEAEAAVRNAELDLSYTEIRSPIAGRVDREYVDVGNLVGDGGATLLTTVLSEDPIYASFAISERDLLRILGGEGRAQRDEERPRREVRLTLADGRDYPTPGVIDFGSNTVNPETGTLDVRAVFPNPDAVLYPGLFVRIRVPERTGEAVIVPQEVVLRDVAGPYVLVVGAEGVVERRGVTLGPVVDEGRVIDGGLEADDRVVVNGLQRARPGLPVNPSERAGG